MPPYSEEASMLLIDPRIRVTIETIEDYFPKDLRTVLVDGGDYVWQYDFDTSSYVLTPLVRDRVGYGVWIAKLREYNLRWGVLLDRHQLRIYLGWRAIVFGKRDLDLLVGVKDAPV